MKINLEKQLRIWKTLLIVGLIIYPFIGGYFLLGSVVLTSGGSVSEDSFEIASIFQSGTILALFAAVGCLLVSKYFVDQGNLKKGILALQLPFMLGILLGVLFFFI